MNRSIVNGQLSMVKALKGQIFAKILLTVSFQSTSWNILLLVHQLRLNVDRLNILNHLQYPGLHQFKWSNLWQFHNIFFAPLPIFVKLLLQYLSEQIMLLFLFVKSFKIFYLPEAALSIYNIQVLSVLKIHTDQAFDDLKLETQQVF